jgi:hypothetical protein
MQLAHKISTALAANNKKVNIKLDIPQDQMSDFMSFKSILSEFQQWCNFYPPSTTTKCDYTISSNPDTLKEAFGKREVTLSAAAGSIVNGTLFVFPMARTRTQSGDIRFILTRWIQKLINPEKFYRAGQFSWALVDHDCTLMDAVEFLNECTFQAWDMENSGRQDIIPSINGISGLHKDGRIRTFVFDFRNWYHVKALQLLAASDAVKITQNGTYDISYYFRWGMPLKNWYLDTFNMMHAWYAELPRDLGFISSFMIREFAYWKDESNGNFMEYCRYNAKDAWATLHCALAILLEWPEWAKKNYAIQFPYQIPLIQAGMHGLRIDEKFRAEKAEESEAKSDEILRRLRYILGDPLFNPASPDQVVLMLKCIGGSEFESSDASTMEAFSFKHPFNATIAELITDYRKEIKAKSNYWDVLTWGGRLYYKFLAGGTETGRLSGKSSDFAFNENHGELIKPKWIHFGFQIQNVPYYAKKMILADEGFLLYEADKEQAETRCTAYLAQEKSLIHRVEHEPDFHCANVTAFFGIPFDQVYDPNGKTKDEKVLLPDIRQLTKKLNHGASYNMAWQVLLVNMGEKNVWKAKSLLKLPRDWGLKEVTQFLISKFCEAVPHLKGINYSKTSHSRGVTHLFTEQTYYAEIITAVEQSRKFVSPLGWTRYCFDNPRMNKPAMNAYVAHPSQNLSVGDVNESMLRMYNDKRLQNFDEFRVNGQVHDSIPYQIRIGLEEKYNPIVRELFEKPIIVHGRSMLIPVDISKGKESWK